GFYADPKNLKPAVAHLERTKFYPLNGKASAKPMSFPDASDVPANMLPISDGSVFNQLKLLVDSEGTNLAGPDGLGMLAAIGIVKGQPFKPDANTQKILDRAAKTAYKMSRVIGFEEKVSGRSLRVYSDRRWVNPFPDGTHANPTGVLNMAWGERRWEVYGLRRPGLDVHRLLLDQSRDGVSNAGPGRQIHDCLHRRPRHATGG